MQHLLCYTQCLIFFTEFTYAFRTNLSIKIIYFMTFLTGWYP